MQNKLALRCFTWVVPCQVYLRSDRRGDHFKPGLSSTLSTIFCWCLDCGIPEARCGQVRHRQDAGYIQNEPHNLYQDQRAAGTKRGVTATCPRFEMVSKQHAEHYPLLVSNIGQAEGNVAGIEAGPPSGADCVAAAMHVLEVTFLLFMRISKKK